MAEPINLNKARKAKARRDAKDQAAQNRVTFGQPRPLRDKARKDTARAAKDLDGKKLD
ncbi:MAG: DUF4169 family protein [Ferrovibrio sp.]|uniref:DUF4169 family protein n=1 Tax=Ferrovibrio sp. TaxID=1917215 RepID=UPI002615E1B6|nr:DUF4169 family protein [Ferrovibrio sp.]MCW0235204.1 DUF4169 family protein [Ferrovibrio sp.]